MARLNIISAIIIIAIAIAALYFTQQNPKNFTKQITSPKKNTATAVDNDYLNEINKLKETLKFHEKKNLQLRETTERLVAQKTALEKSKTQLVVSNTKLNSFAENLEKMEKTKQERLQKKRKQRLKNLYAITKKKHEEKKRTDKASKKRKKKVSKYPMNMIESLTSFTPEQKEFKKAIKADMEEYSYYLSSYIEERMDHHNKINTEYQTQMFTILTEKQKEKFHRLVKEANLNR